MSADDIRERIRKTFEKELGAYEKITVLAQDLLDRHRDKFVVVPRRPSTAVVAALFAKAWKTAHAIYLLACAGYGQDAVDLARTLTNLCIDLGYICEGDSDKRARLWSAAGQLERLKIKRDFKGALSKREEARYSRLKALTKPWTDLKIEGRARQSGRQSFYTTTFRHGSSYSHSDSWSAASFLKRNPDAIEALNAPSETDVGDALFMAVVALADIVVTCGQFYGMDIRAFDQEMRPVIEKGFDGEEELRQ
ncbi:MAG: DUF5677 domain-containing protein [Candidatus Rokuibacteriota bacterium]